MTEVTLVGVYPARGEDTSGVASYTAKLARSLASQGVDVGVVAPARAGDPPVEADGPVTVAIADLNGDGDLDLVAANYYSDNLTVWFGNGAGAFAPGGGGLAANQPLAIATGDFNADGDADLVVAAFYSDSVYLLAGNGDGTFQLPIALPTALPGGLPRSVAVADLDSDGRADLITGNYLGNSLSVLLGNGNGGFQAPKVFAAGNGPQAIAAIDLNNDGRIDLAAASYFGDNITVLLQGMPLGVGPAVSVSQFFYLTAPQRLSFVFTSDVRLSLSPTDLDLVNLTTGATIASGGMQLIYEIATDTATFSFPGSPAGVLPDGNYRARLIAAGISDPQGNPLPGDVTLDFFVLAGDANRDRAVDLGDFSIVASSFNMPGDFAAGDFNYSGVVEIGDFAILAGNYNTTLSPPGRTPHPAPPLWPVASPMLAGPATRFASMPLRELLDL